MLDSWRLILMGLSWFICGVLVFNKTGDNSLLTSGAVLFGIGVSVKP